MILETSVGSTHMAQALDSLCYTKKTLIPHAWDFVTSKVTASFSVTPFKSIAYTLHALPTEVFSLLFVKSHAKEPLAKARVDERQSRFESIFEME